jgi:hypothetical protein
MAAGKNLQKTITAGDSAALESGSWLLQPPPSTRHQDGSHSLLIMQATAGSTTSGGPSPGLSGGSSPGGTSCRPGQGSWKGSLMGGG